MTITNKPCPFCGETKYLKQEGDTVICDTCFGGDWNTRPIEDGLRAEIEALQKQVDDTTFMFLERQDEKLIPEVI